MRQLVEEQGLACTSIDRRHPDPQQWILIHHPGTTVPLAEATEAQRILILQKQLATNHQQLMSIRRHPYVRLGLKFHPFLTWVAFMRRRIARWTRELLGGPKT